MSSSTNTFNIGNKVGTYGIWKGEARGKFDTRNTLNNLSGKEWIRLTSSTWEFNNNYMIGIARNIIRMFTSNNIDNNILTYNDSLNLISKELLDLTYRELEEDTPSIDIEKFNTTNLLNLNANGKTYQLTISYLTDIFEQVLNEEEIQEYNNWLTNNLFNISNKLYKLTSDDRYSVVITNDIYLNEGLVNVANQIIHYFNQSGFEYKGKITAFAKNNIHSVNEKNYKYVLIFYKPFRKLVTPHKLHLPKENKISNQNYLIEIPNIMFSKSKIDPIGKLHPATYSYIDIENLIKLFVGVNKDALIFDPFLGVGSTTIAADLTGNKSIGIDLNRNYIELAKERLQAFFVQDVKLIYKNDNIKNARHLLIEGDSTKRINGDDIPMLDYCITSPPYHSILRNDGKGVRNDDSQFRQGIKYYSEMEHDIGNQEDYDDYIALFVKVMKSTYGKLRDNACCSIVISDFTVSKKELDISGDIIGEMANLGFIYKGSISLVQSQKVIYPFGYPYRFVINHTNQFVINFQKLC